MSQSVAKLAVELVGRDANLRKTFEQSKQQGRGWANDLSGSSRLAAIGIAGVGSVAAIAAVGVHSIAVESAAAGRELEASATTARLNVEAMQAVQYATESVGISGEKSADIMKDFQDKLGDFRSTGGGAFADFFEQVADKSGITADALAKLSGPDALIAVKKAMDDANVSADRQTFYLEALASDASRLLPLLENGGEGFRQMTDRFNGLNAAMSQSEIDKFKDYEQDIKDTQLQWDALTRTTAVPFLGVLKETLRVMNDIFGDKEGNLVRTLANGYVKNSEDTLKQMIIRTKETMVQLEEDAAKDDFWSGKDDAARENLARKKIELQALEDALKRKSGPLFKPVDGTTTGGTTGTDEDKKHIATAQKQGIAALARMDTQFADEQGKLRLQNEQRLAGIEQLQLSEQEIQRRGFASIERLKDDYRQRSQDKYQADLAALQVREIDKTRADIEQIRQGYLTKEQLELQHWQERQTKLADWFVAEQEAHRGQKEQLAQIEQEYLWLSGENQREYQNAIGAENDLFWQNYLQSIRDTADNTDQIWANTLSNISSRTSSLIMDSIKDWQGLGHFMKSVMAGAGQAVIQTLIDIGVQRMVLWVLENTLAKTGQAGYVAQVGGQAASQVYMAGLNAFTSTAAIPIVGPVMAPAAMGAAMAVASPMAGGAVAAAASSMAGMAHDGIDNIPREGTWLLDKGERVLSPRQNKDFTDYMANGGNGRGMVVNIHNNAGVNVSQEQSGPNQLEVFIDAAREAVAGDIYTGGNGISSALEGRYGISRAAGAY